MENLGNYLVAIKLANEDSWDQWFGDATSAHNITFSSLALGCLGADNVMDTTHVSSAIFLRNETAPTVSQTWLDKVRSHGVKLCSLTHRTELNLCKAPFP